MQLDELLRSCPGAGEKGFPPGMGDVALEDVGRMGWNVLKGDLPFPLAVIRHSALKHNLQWMQSFVDQSGVKLCPHGKTTMSPQLFKLQLDAGAWGITVATGHQLRVCREFGIKRIFYANQLISGRDVEYVCDELKKDPDFEFFSLVDAVEQVALLERVARARFPGRPIQVLIEGGHPGGRAGCRTVEQALEVATAIHAASPYVALRGIEGFEGLLKGDAEGETKVAGFLDFLLELAGACLDRGLFSPGPLLLTAGGSALYDMVVEKFGTSQVAREYEVVLRSGCYLTHDATMYARHFEDILRRSTLARDMGEGLRPALEIWGLVQSLPEPGKAIINVGKRDCSYDVELPVPSGVFRPSRDLAPSPLPPGYETTMLNDQHAHVRIPEPSILGIGDLVSFAIAHPCTTFDKWRYMHVVDDDYHVVECIRTFF